MYTELQKVYVKRRLETKLRIFWRKNQKKMD